MFLSKGRNELLLILIRKAKLAKHLMRNAIICTAACTAPIELSLLFLSHSTSPSLLPRLHLGRNTARLYPSREIVAEMIQSKAQWSAHELFLAIIQFLKFSLPPPMPGLSVFPCFKNEIPRVLLRYVIVNVSTKQLHLINSEVVTNLSLLIYLTLTLTVQYATLVFVINTFQVRFIRQETNVG